MPDRNTQGWNTHDWQAWVRTRLSNLHIAPARENEIVAELAVHVEQIYNAARAERLSDAEAMRQVEAACGNWRELAGEIERTEPAIPERRAGLFTGAFDDVRHMLRFLLRNPAFAAIAIGTLAFGVGGNTAIFTLADALALRGLPYPQSGRLMAIETHWSKQSEIEPWTAAPDFFDLRSAARSFSDMAALSPVWNDIRTGGPSGAERLDTLYVSASFFPLLGVRATLGRTFSASEDDRTHPSGAAVISDAFWRSRFGASRDVLGRGMVLNGRIVTIVGVLPADFHYQGEPLAGKATDIDVWMPLSDNALIARSRSVRFLKLIGRLKPSVPAERARDEVRAIGRALAEKYPESNRGFTFDAMPLAEKITGRFRGTMALLLGMAGFVLLMACANAANLLLTRAAVRQRDYALRFALGASSWRVVRQMMTEALVLAGAGGAAGIALAWAGVRLMNAAAPPALLSGNPIALDGRVAAFTVLAILVSAALSGFPPAFSVLRDGIGNSLRQGSRTFAGGNRRFRAWLVIGETASAFVLLAGAGLLILSFRHLLDVPPGFDPRNLVTVSTQTPVAARTEAQRKAIYELIRERLLSVPGVTGVGAVSRLPMMGSNLGSEVTMEGKSRPGEQAPDVEYRVATPDYFTVMRIPLRQGRLFTDRDDDKAPPVALINETMARKFWPGESAVGKRIKLGPHPEAQPWIAIAGVVGDVHHFGLDVDTRPEVYRPYATSPLFAPILVIRTASDPGPLASALAAKVRSVDAELPAYDLFLMQTLVDRSMAQRRFTMSMLAGFAIAALFLAAIGIYGIVAQSVAQRTQEIGIRMALGSPPGAALGLMFREGMRLAAIGLILGLAAAAGLTRLIQNLLFGVKPFDPAAFAAAAAVLAISAAVACYAPARRATRVDPLTALRQDG